MKKRVAVVIYNLGGPDNLDAVQPFLFNLFNDPHIITLPQPFRWMLAKIISSSRHKKSQGIYEQMGGKSTILEETQKQVKELEKYLNTYCNLDSTIVYDVMPMMRYWHPMSNEVKKQVLEGKYNNVLLLPLYPQFSTTTTLSSLRDWFKKSKNMPTTSMVCCYYNHPGFIDAWSALLNETISRIKSLKTIRILFSAHSIPQYISDKGDPYQMQIQESVKAIMNRDSLSTRENIAHTICYQSKVGRMKWLGPDLHSELIAAGKRDEIVVVVPISFISEHSETLVELDIEYAEIARENLIEYYRVPTPTTHHLFIKTLASLTVRSLEKFFQGIVENANIKPYDNVSITTGCHAKLCCQRLKLK